MNGFRTARALVLDDQPHQAMAVVGVLGALGIASCYHDAELDRDYSSKHSGVRLLFLDMVLENRGADASSEQSVVDVLVGALEDLLDKSPGFAVLVCWTSHDDIRPLLEQRFKEVFPDIHLAGIVFEKKSDYIDVTTGSILESGKQFSVLLKRVETILREIEPAALLSNWEQVVHQAASRTSGTIYGAAAQFARTPGTDWASGAYAVCAALAAAERGTRLAGEDAAAAVKGLADALGPLLLDRIENTPDTGVSVSDDILNRLFQTVLGEFQLWKKKESLLPAAVRGQLNASFNVSVDVQGGEVCPGTLYLIGNENRISTRRFFNRKFHSGFVDDTFKDREGVPPTGSFPLFIEVTAGCDFAQAKGKLPRFLFGFLIPVAESAAVKSGAYIRKVCFFTLGKEHGVAPGDYLLVVNAHYLSSLPSAVAAKLKPSMRLRVGILSDVIAWLSEQMSRPGFLQLTPVPAATKPVAAAAPATKKK